MKVLLFLSSVFIGTLGYSQQHEISANIGYGGAEYEPYGSYLFLVPYHPVNQSVSLSLGGRYHYNFDKKLLRLNIGTMYQYKSFDNLHQLSISIGINLNHGKKVRFFYGLRVNTKFLLSNTPYPLNTPAPSREYKNVQFGWYYEIGLGYRLNERLELNLAYQMNMDLTELYLHNTFSPNGSYYRESTKEFDALLRLGVTYSLK